MLQPEDSEKKHCVLLGENHVYTTIINHGNSVYCFKGVGDNLSVRFGP